MSASHDRDDGHDGDGTRRARGPFGPLGALDDVQRQAVDAALRITNELTALSSGLTDGSWLGDRLTSPLAAGDPLRTPADVGRLRSDVAKATDTFADLLRALLDVGFDAMDELARRPDARPVGAAAPGQQATVRCTVRNGPDAAVGLRPHVPQLASAAGTALDAAVTVRPEDLDLQPHERREVEIRVAVPSGADPGRYHGLLLVTGLPDSAQPVAIEVTDDDR